MPSTQFIKLLRYATIAGNMIFMLWITYNGTREGFKGTWPEKASYLGLMGLLAINSFFLLNNKKGIPKNLQS